MEKPIVSHPLPEYFGSNCGHCFKSMKAPLPCPVCTKVLFCSYDCRAAALSTYHPYECKIMDFLIASGMSIGKLIKSYLNSIFIKHLNYAPLCEIRD